MRLSVPPLHRLWRRPQHHLQPHRHQDRRGPRLQHRRVKLNRKGVRQLLQSPEMENALTGIAFAAQNRLGEGYKASYYKASTRVVAKVSAESPAARKENADTNSILKALK